MVHYGSEFWTLSALDTIRIEALVMWTWRKMMENSWTERKSNRKVLIMVQEQKKIIKMTEKRSIKFFEHVI